MRPLKVQLADAQRDAAVWHERYVKVSDESARLSANMVMHYTELLKQYGMPQNVAAFIARRMVAGALK